MDISTIYDEDDFLKLIESIREPLKKFCADRARNANSTEYDLEDFLQEALFAIWDQFRKDGGVTRPAKAYLTRGKWRIYDLLGKLSKDKRNKRLMTLKEEFGVTYVCPK